MKTRGKKNSDGRKFYGQVDLFDLIPSAKKLMPKIEKNQCNVDITDLIAYSK